jgi:aryl-alcohol dehydrogenase-like predicted oxidoreductase
VTTRDLTRRHFLGEGAVAVGAGLAAGAALAVNEKTPPPKDKILSYNERMEYRRLGKTEQWVSAVCLGGHWKRCPFEGEDFQKNRTEIVARCLDSGINYVDACWQGEVMAYSKALKTLGKRKQMLLGFDAYGSRAPEHRTRKALLAQLDQLMKEAGLDVVDVWRITCHEPGGMHTYNESCEFAAAGEEAIKQGKVRFFGTSSHDRRWHEMMIREFPVFSVIIFPYTAKSKEKPKDSIFEAVRKYDVGVFGIKPYSSNSLFLGQSTPDDPNREEDDKRARMALRYILTNPSIAAPIPGLIYPHHVDNCLKAIEERRKEDLAARPAILDSPELAAATRDMFDRLPAGYHWLKDWEWV